MIIFTSAPIGPHSKNGCKTGTLPPFASQTWDKKVYPLESQPALLVWLYMKNLFSYSVSSPVQQYFASHKTALKLSNLQILFYAHKHTHTHIYPTHTISTMGLLRRFKKKGAPEHPLNTIVAQISSQAPETPSQPLDIVCVCAGPCGCDVILNFTGESPSRLKALWRDEAHEPKTPPKRNPVQRMALQAIEPPNSLRMTRPIAAPECTLIKTPLNFAHSPLRPGESQRYDQQTSSWHIIAKAGPPKSKRATASPMRVQKPKKKPIQPRQFYFEMPGAFPE